MKLQELKEKLLSIELPTSIKLNKCTYIKDVNLMVDSHIAMIENNKSNKKFMPYYNRLLELYDKINN